MRWRSGRGSGSTSRRARDRESSRTRTRKPATTRSRSSTISPAIPASGTISPRPVRRKFASSPRCSRASAARRRSRQPASARPRPQHRPRHRRRLVVPSREHLRRSNGQHAELRPHRARRRAVHPCVRRVAVVHAVTRGAADRPGGSPARRRGQPARVSPKAVRGVSRSPGSRPATASDSPARAGGPGRFEPGGRTRNPAGPQFKNFDEFMERRAKGQPVRLLVREHAIRTGLTSPEPARRAVSKRTGSRCRDSFRTRSTCATICSTTTSRCSASIAISAPSSRRSSGRGSSTTRSSS